MSSTRANGFSRRWRAITGAHEACRRALVVSHYHLHVLTQPTPNITAADVERVVRRDYAADRVDEVHKMLGEYGQEDWHPEVDRVRMAILKLAAGNFDELRMHLEIAKRDFRDVLSAAEYPGYTKKWFHIDKLPPHEKQEIIDADWKQYQDWLQRK